MVVLTDTVKDIKINKNQTVSGKTKAKYDQFKKIMDKYLSNSITGIWRAYEMDGSKAIPPKAY